MTVSGLFQYPIYFCTLLFLFWGVQFSGFLYHVKFLNFTTPRADFVNWAEMMRRFFRIRYTRYKNYEVLYQQGTCMYLCNHRSWSDFFVDHYLTCGRCAAIARLMVWVALPVFMTYGLVSRAMFFFRRGSTTNKEKFNAWLDRCWDASPYPGLIVYPEGHRNNSSKSLVLKKGMLWYAYLRKVPCQLLITNGKEHPFNEKKWKIQFGCEIRVAYSKLILPEKFPEFEDFFKEIQTKWDEMWNLLYSTNNQKEGKELNRAINEKESELVPFQWKEYEKFDLPFKMRVLCAISMIGGMILFFLVPGLILHLIIF